MVALSTLHDLRNEMSALQCMYDLCTYHSMQLHWLCNDRGATKYFSYVQEQEVPEETL
jgi:hypothetical protein